MNRSLVIPREVLLVEIERRCSVDAECNARARIGLTKEEARAYCGFTCERCERWNEDILTERDVPEWWEELTITGLSALRETPAPAATVDEPAEVIKRLSDNYKTEIEHRTPDAGKDGE
ncbi:MAG TPA: hypothetical protein VF528_16720 [Pyrinomonadaceae bacterium]|jgi:hypothetical protein